MRSLDRKKQVVSYGSKKTDLPKVTDWSKLPLKRQWKKGIIVNADGTWDFEDF